jgi:S-DNA-T family DNA segregation ATPase FtsK/SpoIIIE
MAESSQRMPGAVAWDVRRLLYFALATFLLVALGSYSPSDPSWTTWSSSRYVANMCGRLGSLVADFLAQCFGLAAFAFPALAMAMAVRRRPEVAPDRGARWQRTAVFALYVAALATVLETQLDERTLPLELTHAGGALGYLLARAARFLVGPRGAQAVAMLAFVVATMVLFRWAILTWLVDLAAALVRRALAWREKGAPKLAAWRLCWPFRRRSPSTAVVPVTPPIASTPLPPSASASSPVPATTARSSIAEVAIATASLAADAEELARLLPKRSTATKEAKPAPSRSARKPGQSYELPELDLLSGRAEAKIKTVDRNWYLEKASILVEKLKDFGVEGEVVNISPGPVITVYEFRPASGVKIKEIANLSDDLTLALSVLSVRIVAPIPGKPVVGIEIPSPFRETVYFKDLIQETGFYDPALRIPIVLGRLASGEPVIAGLASMPHLLVAGSTGTGKSVFINTLIASLLYRYTPDQLKLILVDPKMVELASYEGIPHLLLPVVVDSRKAAMALRWAVDEMERRYSMLHEAGVRHIDAYNDKVEAAQGDRVDAKNGGKLPYIVVVIDEYADLMATVPKDVELSITRLAQKARASGIHLVLATQRPSTDVVTGTIKANFPSRISFRVASSVDSKTILDRTGADRLLGAGDMLFHSAGFTTLKRLQGAFLSDAELERIVSHWREQGEPEYDERLLQYQEEAAEATEGELESESGGDLYDRAVRLVAEKGEASISLIQRHLKIGYNRAASLMEEMEKQGVVAQQTGTTKRRAVLVSPT